MDFNEFDRSTEAAQHVLDLARVMKTARNIVKPKMDVVLADIKAAVGDGKSISSLTDEEIGTVLGTQDAPKIALAKKIYTGAKAMHKVQTDTCADIDPTA